MTPLVLVHGGGFGASCWDGFLAYLDGPVLAVDLPGRGAHPAPLSSVTLADCATSVAADVDAAGFDEIVLVGHSLAGCSMPGIVGRLGDRVRHAVFVAATVPEQGLSCLDTLPAEFQAVAADIGEDGLLDPSVAKLMFGNDLDDEQFAWCMERMVPEAPQITAGPVDLSPLRSAMPRTWVRTMKDTVVSTDKQLRFAANVGDCAIVDIDAGHMCMVSQPEALAAILRPLVG